MKPVLILGGTEDAAALTVQCQKIPGVLPIVSLAGRTTQPVLPDVAVRIGGFGGADGMAEYLRAEAIAALVDATHPFASRISANAAEAARITGTPYLLLQRPAWTPVVGDIWQAVGSEDDAARLLPPGGRAFLALGAQRLGAFAGRTDLWFLVRTVDPPPEPLLPGPHEAITGRGPFRVDDETALLERYRISHVVCRNSGGEGAGAKLDAARSLALPVIMIERTMVTGGPSVATAAEAHDWLKLHIA